MRFSFVRVSALVSCLGLVVATVLLAPSFAAEPVSAQSSATPYNVSVTKTGSGARVRFSKGAVTAYYKVYIWTSWKASCSSLSGSDHVSSNIVLSSTNNSRNYYWNNSDALSASVLSACVVLQVDGDYTAANAVYDATVFYGGASITDSGDTATVSWSSGATTMWHVYIWTSRRSDCSDYTGSQKLGYVSTSASTKTYAWTDAQVSGTDFLSACIVPRLGSFYRTSQARLVRWQYLCNATDYPSTSLGEPLGLTAGESRTVAGTIPATEGSRQCKDVARKRSVFYTLEIPADAGGAVKVTAVKGYSNMYPEVLVRKGEDNYSGSSTLFHDTRTATGDADARGLVESGTTYTVQLRARDTTGVAQAGEYTLKVERLLPAFLRYSYQSGVLHGYWDSKVEEGNYFDAGRVLSCGSARENCRYGVSDLYGEYKVNDGAWTSLGTNSPPSNRNSSTVDLSTGVSGIEAGDEIQLRARYSGTNIPTTEYVESPVQIYFGEVRLPPPYALNLDEQRVSEDPLTYEVTAQWNSFDFGGSNLGSLEWAYYLRLNEEEPFAVIGDSGRALEEVFLWRELGLLQVNVRVSAKCTLSSGSNCRVTYGTNSYSIPGQTTWISTWSEATLLNIAATQDVVATEAVAVPEPSALVIGIIYTIMDAVNFNRSEELAVALSLVLCLALASGVAWYLLKKLKPTFQGVAISSGCFLFIFVGLGLELFGVPPALVVIVVSIPCTLAALVLIRRFAL